MSKTQHNMRTSLLSAPLTWIASLVCLALGLLAVPTTAQALTQEELRRCVASGNAGTTAVRADGSFLLWVRNRGFIRVAVNCPEIDGQPVQGQSRLIPLGVFGIVDTEVPFSLRSEAPVSFSARAGAQQLIGIGERTEIRVEGKFAGGERRNLTYASTGTTYVSSNASVLQVDGSGIVKAIGSGVASVGIINQGRSAALRFVVLEPGEDSDGDGMSDLCELENGLDPQDPSDALQDPDLDGRTNRDECADGTDPFDEDSDDDGLNDGDEFIRGTDPLNPDTDFDELPDGQEISLGTDPLDPDTDDGCALDGFEVAEGLDPLDDSDDASDVDGDSLDTCTELALGTDPADADTDNDALTDFEEVFVGNDGFITDPLDIDTDDDGLNDGAEVAFGSDPTDPFDMELDPVVTSFERVAGQVSLNSLTLIGGSIRQASGTDGLFLTVVGTLSVDVSSGISATGTGYEGSPGNGPGSADTNGGSYGGLGGRADPNGFVNDVYGDYRDPAERGSKGGGGLLRIQAGEIVLDGGISATVGASCGSGSGGGIRIDTGVLRGSGRLNANGGQVSAGCGTGGGGRIAIYFADMSLFTGTIEARGGQGSVSDVRGGAGTIYLKADTEPFGELIIENSNGVFGAGVPTPEDSTPLRGIGSGRSGALSANALTDANASFPVPDSNTRELGLVGLELKPNQDVEQSFTIIANTATELFTDPNDGDMLAVGAAGDSYIGVHQLAALTATNEASVSTPDEIVLNRGAGQIRRLTAPKVTLEGDSLTLTDQDWSLRDVGSAVVNFSGDLTLLDGDLTCADWDISVGGTLTVDTDSIITVSRLGPAPGVTLGNEFGSTTGNGGSFGGLGGLADPNGQVNAVYGDFRDPVEAGSGGGDAAAGGRIRIQAGDMVLDGIVSATGQSAFCDPGPKGAGSGGGIRIDTGILEGTGRVAVQGGNGAGGCGGGGGGGGRIAIYASDMSGYAGGIFAFGGTSDDPNTRGGSGTIFLKEDADPFGALFVDNQEPPFFSTDPAPDDSTPLRSIGPGRSTQLMATTLTDANASFPVPDPNIGTLGLIGLELNPKRDQEQTFTVLNNTATQIFTDPGDGDMTALAAAGDRYIGVYTFSTFEIDIASVITEDEILVKETADLARLTAAKFTFEGSELTNQNLSLFDVGEAVIRSPGNLTLTDAVLWNPTWDIRVGGTLITDIQTSINSSGGLSAGQTVGSEPASTAGNGGSYGGLGGRADPNGIVNDVYGDYRDPRSPGSGGGETAGGGLIRIQASDFIHDGVIGAGARFAGCGSGSGGGIRIDTGILQGAGIIAANGRAASAGTCGGGGGGRVAIYYSDLSSFTGRIEAVGGPADNPDHNGGAGTIFLRQDSDLFGEIIIDNTRPGGFLEAPEGSTPLRSVGSGTSTGLSAATLADASAAFPVPDPDNDVLGLIGLELNPNRDQAQTFTVIGNTATQIFTDPNDGDMTAVAATGDAYIGVYSFDRLVAQEGANAATADAIVVADTFVPGSQFSGTSITFVGDRIDFTRLTTFEEIILLPDANQTLNNSNLDAPRIEADVPGTLTVEASSNLRTRHLGLPAGETLGGRPGSTSTNGGSHGGLGGLADPNGAVNATYGDFRDPREPGSGGGAAAGGGVMFIRAGHLVVDGILNGVGASGCGAGAGGSMRLDIGTLSGNGIIGVQGGAPNPDCGGGGGGRMAIYYSDISAYTGELLAHGAGTAPTHAPSGAGTLFLKQDAQLFGDLIVDNDRFSTSNPAPLGSTPLRAVGSGVSAGLVAHTLTDLGASFPEPDPNGDGLGLIGLELNPNAGQGQTFTIIDNNATQLFTDPNDGDMTSVASTGNAYVGVYTFDNVDVLDGAQVETQDQCLVLGTLTELRGGNLTCQNLP